MITSQYFIDYFQGARLIKWFWSMVLLVFWRSFNVTVNHNTQELDWTSVSTVLWSDKCKLEMYGEGDKVNRSTVIEYHSYNGFVFSN